MKDYRKGCDLMKDYRKGCDLMKDYRRAVDYHNERLQESSFPATWVNCNKSKT